MLQISRTTAGNQDFIDLVVMLNAELAERDGEDHEFYHQFNHIDHLKYVILLKDKDRAIGCGAINPLEDSFMEVKRMFVIADRRGQGLAGVILKALEEWALELGRTSCRLETGQRQPEAIALYQKHGYKIIRNYGQYAGIDNSVCFEKCLE